MPRFDIVDLSKNQISSVTNISGLISWYTSAQASSIGDFSILNVSRNFLSRLNVNDFALYSNLKVLDLSWNNISFIDPRVFGAGNTALTKLDLRGNPIMNQQAVCPNEYRKIAVEFSSAVTYPACTKLRIVSVNPHPSTYSTLSEDFILRIEVEGLELDLIENQVTLNGLKCERLEFQNPISYTRVGTLICKPSKSLVPYLECDSSS
jgi:hypothetical protein